MAFFKKELKKVYHEVKMDLGNKPEIYKLVRRLNSEISSEVNRNMFPTNIQDAAKQLYAQLKDAMNCFDDKTNNEISFIKKQNALQCFAKECHTTIFAHQPTLMAAPGFWNQLKAIINNLMEQYFSINPIFDTNKSALGLKGEFSKSFNDVKRALTPESNTIEPSRFSTHL